jgi:hypothetical protein
MALGSPVVVSPSLLRRACVSSVEEALSRAEKVTYPVWLHLAVPTHGANPVQQRWTKCRVGLVGIAGGRKLTRPFRDARRFPSPGLPVPRA